MTDRTFSLTIETVTDGGYLVLDTSAYRRNPQSFVGPVLACTSLDEALRYIKGKLAPEETTPVGMMRNMEGRLHPIPDKLEPETCAISGNVDCAECAQVPLGAAGGHDIPPAGYLPLVMGEHCKCPNEWKDSDGRAWCCKAVKRS